MYHQGLRPHGLYKPACLEQGRKSGLRRRVKGMIAASEHSRADHEIHQQVSQNVKHRADRPHPEHKLLYGSRVPAAGLPEKFLIHMVPGKGSAGYVIHHI